jgi:hypothetical protein
MIRTLSLLAIGCAVLVAGVARAEEPLENQTYAALSGAPADLDADVACAEGGCYASRAALDGYGYNLDGIAGLHGSITYRVQLNSRTDEIENLVNYDLTFCQQLFPGVSMLVQIGTGGSFQNRLNEFNDFYHPGNAFQKARLKQAYLHIN